MKKSSVVSLLLIALILPIQGNALEKGLYIKGDLGGSMPHDKMKKASGYINKKRSNVGPQYSAGIGYNATNNLRLDVTFSHMGDFKYRGTAVTLLGQTLNQHKKTKADMLTLNAYYHFFEDKSPIVFAPSPFIGVGIGAVKIQHGSGSITSSDSSVGKVLIKRPSSTNVAFNAIAGVSTTLTKNLVAEWSYKYAYLGNFKNGVANSYVSSASKEIPLQPKKQRFNTHNLAVGLRYNF